MAFYNNGHTDAQNYTAGKHYRYSEDNIQRGIYHGIQTPHKEIYDPSAAKGAYYGARLNIASCENGHNNRQQYKNHDMTSPY